MPRRVELTHRVVKEFPTMFSKTACGTRMKTWSILVMQDTESEEVTLQITHGLKGKRMVVTDRPIKEGKNIGKANETTPLSQALLEASARVEKQYKAGYRVDEKDLATVPIKPMLAVSYEKVCDKFNPDELYLIQPKLNGVRCLVHRNGDKLTFQTRGGLEYESMHSHTKLCEELLKVMPDDVTWDGELYMHQRSLQQTVSAVKDLGDDTLNIQYWVYDAVETSQPYIDRFLVLSKHLENVPLDYVKLTPTITVKGDTAIFDKYFKDFTDDGYEGLIIRQYNGGYKLGLRSKFLIKRKKFEDREYKISGFYSDVNMCIIFSFFNKGNPFNAVPAWSQEERKTAYKEGMKDLNKWVGKMATVSASDISDDGIPIGNPVVVAIRDYE